MIGCPVISLSVILNLSGTDATHAMRVETSFPPLPRKTILPNPLKVVSLWFWCFRIETVASVSEGGRSLFDVFDIFEEINVHEEQKNIQTKRITG